VAAHRVTRYEPGMNRFPDLLRTLVAAGVVGIVAANAAHAADASAWSNDARSSVRLIAGSNAGGKAPLHAGVEMKLLPGWHTYWRYSGDSGVPPRFDFSGSTNLASAKVLYPAPSLHSDEAGQTIGYNGSVVFPVEVTPKEAARPVELRLKIDYAVCEKLCVPAEGTAALTIAPGESSEDAAVNAAFARVPVQLTPRQAGLTVHRLAGDTKPLVMVDLPGAPQTPLAVFAEGPTPDWALPIPKPVAGAPDGYRRFSFELDGLPPGVDPGKGPFDLTFTVVGGAPRAYEVTTRLD
jgi:DsbC/DsbD-like thiol-disulfide interchange protein